MGTPFTSSVSTHISVAAGTAEIGYVTPPAASGAWELTSCAIVPLTTTAVHAANYVTCSIKNGGTTLGSTTTNSSGGSALTAGTPQSPALSGGTSLEFTAGTDVVTIDIAHTGSGAAFDCLIECFFQKIRA